ncbi:MAG TPA: hypothetical protein VM408_03410 [Methylomirabilota bacterium]|nr:hypothetical protein [Methylomirabilota bacterium]
MAKPTDQDGSLKRLGGGRWQTRDERFTIEPQSGTWVVVDTEQTDELGMALVRGPFGSLGAAKEAIAGARDAEPAASPLSERAAKLRDRPGSAPGGRDAPDAPGEERGTERPASGAATGRAGKATKSRKPEPKKPAEPRWILSLESAERRRATRLIEKLTEAGAPDPEGIARRDIVGEVPAAAAFAIANALRELGKDAPPARVAELLASGRDEDLGVRWRLVDDDDRPITLDLDATEPR